MSIDNREAMVRQLRLLEQQNQRHSLAQQQRKDQGNRNEQHGSSGQSLTQSADDSLTGNEQRGMQDNRSRVGSVANQNNGTGSMIRQRVNEVAGGDGKQQGLPECASKRRKRNDLSSSHADSMNGQMRQQEIFGVDNDLRSSNQVEQSRIIIVYQVHCKKEKRGRHPVPAFRDAPIPGATRNGEAAPDWAEESHLGGTDPVFDLEKFISEESDASALVVVRKIECSEISLLKARHGLTLSWTEELYVESDELKRALQNVATCIYQPIAAEDGDQQRKRFIHPDLFLFHHRELLEGYILQHPTSKSHIDAFEAYVKSRHVKDFAEADELFASGRVNESHVMKLFKPNEIIVSKVYGRAAAFVVAQWPEFQGDSGLLITCWSFRITDSRYIRKETHIRIRPLGSYEHSICALEAYPLKYAIPETRAAILANGKEQWKLRQATLSGYKGWDVTHEHYFNDVRFMIDHNGHRRMDDTEPASHLGCANLITPVECFPESLEFEQRPPRGCLLLLSPVIHGFNMDEKKWFQLFIDHLHPVGWNKKAFERLVLPNQIKYMIRSLVMGWNHDSQAGKSMDMVSGKGNGLVILLHGEAGTGKTLTAESVADCVEMPLYRVDCGDTSSSAQVLENELSTAMHYGKSRSCMLLLEDIDVLLGKKALEYHRVHALASEFLRKLDCYDGIIIMTSKTPLSRADIFDETFKSGIHVAFRYEPPNAASRRQIWQNFFNMLEEDGDDVNYQQIGYHLDELARKEISGRQIRNIMASARRFATGANERLGWEHILQGFVVSELNSQSYNS